MSFLANLARRGRDHPALVRPRVQALFEPSASDELDDLEVVDESWQPATTRRGQRVAEPPHRPDTVGGAPARAAGGPRSAPPLELRAPAGDGDDLDPAPGAASIPIAAADAPDGASQQPAREGARSARSPSPPAVRASLAGPTAAGALQRFPETPGNSAGTAARGADPPDTPQAPGAATGALLAAASGTLLGSATRRATPTGELDAPGATAPEHRGALAAPEPAPRAGATRLPAAPHPAPPAPTSALLVHPEPARPGSIPERDVSELDRDPAAPHPAAPAADPTTGPRRRAAATRLNLRERALPGRTAPSAPGHATGDAAAAPAVHVTIGRIEVRATTAAPARVTPAPVAEPMSLDEHLRQRAGGRR